MSTPRRSAPWLLAVLVAVLVPVLGSQSASAVGGRCAPGDGVTVVVDYGDMRGGIDLFCDREGGGKTVSQVMSGADVDWQYTSGQPFVCRIQGIPTQEQGEDCVDTPPPTAYWGLFWSDGSPQAWAYSTRGAASLRVPNGGSVGWRFQDGGDRDVPGAAPTAKPSPKPSPSTGGTGGGAGPGGGATSPEPTRAPASRAPGGDLPDPPSAGHAATAAKASKKTADDRTQRADEVRQRPGKARAEGRSERAADRPAAVESEETTEVTSADSELVQPVSGEGGDGSGSNDLPLLVGAALAAVALAAFGGVTARRRRT